MQNSDIYIPKEPGTCATFGCNITYQSHHSCQCNSKCLDYGNCCSDYISHCLDPHASCQKFGCNISFNKENACQCDPDCWKEKQGCCSDWTSLCAYHVRLREGSVFPLHAPYVWSSHSYHFPSCHFSASPDLKTSSAMIDHEYSGLAQTKHLMNTQ